MRRISEIMAWLSGTLALLFLTAAMLLATTPVYAQGPAPGAGCTGCVGQTVTDPNGNTAYAFCDNATCNQTTLVCSLVIFGQQQIPYCLQSFGGGPCNNCSCKAKLHTDGIYYCRCQQ